MQCIKCGSEFEKDKSLVCPECLNAINRALWAKNRRRYISNKGTKDKFIYNCY